MSLLFLLGSERSGSTWLASLLDAHPGVELFMEPFADYARLFPELPAREVPLPDPTPEQVEALRRGLVRLPAHKHPLLFRPGRPAALRALDRALVRLARAAAARLGREPGQRVLRYELLNLHTAALPAALLGPKATPPALRVVKELRLNLQVPLLARARPDARVVVIHRDPVTQIASILRRFEGGSLGELARALDRAFPGGATQPRLAGFRDAITAADGRGRPVETLAQWWLSSHAVLLEDLAASGLRFRLVSHESLCAAPEREVAELLRFAGLPPSAAVDALLRWSTRAAGDPDDPVDVRRVSARVPAAARAALGPDRRDAIEGALRDVARRVGVRAPLAEWLEPIQGAGDRLEEARGAH